MDLARVEIIRKVYEITMSTLLYITLNLSSVYVWFNLSDSPRDTYALVYYCT